MVPEAPLEPTEGGVSPAAEGWFILNARDAVWVDGVFGAYTRLEGAQRFPQLGFNLAVLNPGQPANYYHAEADQEDFLVIAGECVVLIEGQERALKAWDFVHCPPWTEHVFVGAGDGPCTLLGVGARLGGGIRYPVSELAQRYGAGVKREVQQPGEAYADLPEDQPVGYQDGWLPE
jgi:uncharacterized cupin superfamily protein